MATATAWVGLRLDPLDTLFFRDGRPFDAATRAGGGLPQPQTLAGALRTALLARTGFDFAKFARARRGQDVKAALAECGANAGVVGSAFRGPWLALASGDNMVSPLLPLPETLRRAKKDSGKAWSVAKPVASVPGWTDTELKPLWREVPADPKADAELLTLNGLKKFLTGGEPADADCVKKDDLFGFDHRIGIEVDKDTFTAADRMLYVISLLATKREISLAKFKPDDKTEIPEKRTVCLYAEMTLSAELAKGLDDGIVVPFGGEGKYVQVTKVSEQDWPKQKTDTGTALWYLATPTFFPTSGRPLPKPKGKLIAAASAGGVPVSGWDVARNGPRGTRFAVPAGAVYFADGECQPDDFLNTGNANESKDLRQEGWGFALPGTWEGLPK